MKVTEYDRVIRTLIPAYEAMQGAVLEWIGRVVPSGGLVLDLGGGTGRMAHAVAKAFPKLRVEMWDIDRAILDVARERMRDVADRVTVVERSFEGKLPPCDAVVASLSLHHVKEIQRKWEIYSNAYEALRRPGALLVADPSMPTAALARKATYDQWAEFQIAHGYTEAQARQHFVDWQNEDKYFPLHEELEALKAAGFPEPSVFWKQGPMTVYGGIKE